LLAQEKQDVDARPKAGHDDLYCDYAVTTLLTTFRAHRKGPQRRALGGASAHEGGASARQARHGHHDRATPMCCQCEVVPAACFFLFRPVIRTDVGEESHDPAQPFLVSAQELNAKGPMTGRTADLRRFGN
jgi:hypothetical protein